MNDDEFNKPYRRVQAAEDLIEENGLLQLYVDLYRRKFKGQPIIGVAGAEINQCKAFKRAAKDLARELMQHYFTMKDDWFQKQAYSLECLLKNVHKVNADYNQRRPQESMKGFIAYRWHYCDACGNEFQPILPPRIDILNTAIRCETCEKTGAPLFRPTIEERRKAMLGSRSLFPSLPF